VRAVIVDQPPAVLIVIGAHPIEGELRLYAMMVEVGAAQQIMAEHDREEAERLIFRETARTEPEIVSSEQLPAYFDRLVERFRPQLQPYWREELQTPVVAEPVPKPSRLAYDLTLWGGAAIATAGAGVAFAAVALASSGRALCLTRDGSGCPHDRFSAVALGISIGTTGAIASLGTLLFEEPGDVPWLEWTVALLVGGTAYTVAWASLQ
jgi:hypothetical protein